MSHTIALAHSYPDDTRSGVRSAAYDAVSHALQAAVAVLGLIVMLPVLVAIAIAIRIVSPGSVFYRGERIGRGGGVFTIYKFRTLVPGAESQIGARLLRDIDPFHHRLGKFLKRTKLDEIPQLINVIRGNMNLVGPRPIRPVFLHDARRSIPRFDQRFDVRPGMTGMAQVRGGYYTTLRDKLRYDRLYIARRSFKLDAAILMLTFAKLSHRWLSKGTLLALLVLVVSLVPSSAVDTFSVRLFGLSVNALLLAILAIGAYLVIDTDRSNRWFVSHSAIDRPMAAFVFVSMMAVPFSSDPVTAFRGLMYLAITGFFAAFVLVNIRPDAQFARRAVQVLGVIAGGVAGLALLQFVMARTGLTDSASARSVATLGSPLALTAYLVLCFPLVLGEYLITRSEKRSGRLWLALAVALGVAVAAAAGRLGLPALMVSAGILLVKTRRAHVNHVLAVTFLMIGAAAVSGGERFGMAAIAGEISTGVASAWQTIRETTFQQLLVGYGSRTLTRAASVPRSTYLTLLLENGVAGLLLMTWLGALVVREISATVRTQPDALRIRLWSLAAAICGMGVVAISFELFYHLATQLIFWGLIGLALGLCVKYGKRDHGAVLVMRFGH